MKIKAFLVFDAGSVFKVDYCENRDRYETTFSKKSCGAKDVEQLLSKRLFDNSTDRKVTG